MTATEAKKSLNDRVESKIDHLQRLIQHERTSEEEREAARRALKRIEAAYVVETEAKVSEGPGLLYNPGSWAGEKYYKTERLSLTEIAKLIRADLKLARKVGRKTAPKSGDVAVPDPIGDAPSEIRFSVRTEYYSGGGSIDVLIRGIPEEWGWSWEENRWGDLVKTATPAMAALYRAVEEIHRAYNYDNSEGMTDYFERKYWGHVGTDPNMLIPRCWG